MKRRTLAGGVFLACFLVLGLAWALLQWRYPYGHSHCCLKTMFLALELYAQEHGGRYPAGQSSPEASLSLLYREGLIDADVLGGKSIRKSVARRALESGGLLGPETCGWHYVEGLNQTDDVRTAVLWDKEELGHYGERHRKAGREVLLLGGDMKRIPHPQWSSFESEQELMMKNRNLRPTNAIPSLAERQAGARGPSPGNSFAAAGSNVPVNYQNGFESQVRLDVKFIHQEHPLSCEAAALTMALAYAGADVSEAAILSKMPFDKTPHGASVWGDPDQGFVGNIDGKMPLDGYGIHAKALALTARNWKRAESMEGASLSDVARHVQENRPVVVWGFSGKSSPLTWQTPDGRTIRAASGEHTRVVCGFRGRASDPAGFYLIDPNCGLIYWPKKLFTSNWEALNRSAVVVYK